MHAQDDHRSLSIVPSIAHVDEDDGCSFQQSPVDDHNHFDASFIDFNPQPSLDRNASIASNQTIPRSLFRDFDGVHLSPLVDEEIQEEDEEEEEEEEKVNIPPGQDEHSGLPVDSALQLGHEYDQWFSEQWQQAQDEEQDVRGQDQGEAEPGSVNEGLDDTVTGNTTQQWVEPPPPEGMQYYPAPVPRELNMPKRLSRQLPAEVMAKRRSQVLGTFNPEARKSAVWLADSDGQPVAQPGHEREGSSDRPMHQRSKSSLAKLKNLPPQLRASIFFDHEAIPHDIEMKGESATATLENMLDASVHGPPATGLNHRHPDAVGKHRARSSTASLLENNGRASRASMLSAPLTDKKSDGRLSRGSMLSGKRSSSFDNLAQAGNRSSAALSLSRFSFEDKRNSSALDFEQPGLRVVDWTRQ